MNRDVCKHFNPADLPCEKCKAEPVQEPVGYANERDLEQMRRHGGGALLWGKDQLDDLSGYTPLYTAPPERKPLVDPAEYDDAGAAERYNRGLK